VISGIFPVVSLMTLSTIPMAVRSAISLKKNYEDTNGLVPVMQGFVTYSRITGALFVVSFLVDMLLKTPQ